MSVSPTSSKGDVQPSFEMCSQDQHAQAQHWGPPLPLKLSLSLSPSPSLSMHDPMLSLSPSLSMHELSLSMPEPMLSLSSHPWPHTLKVSWASLFKAKIETKTSLTKMMLASSDLIRSW